MRMPWPAAVGGVAVVLLGAAGLVRGAQPLPSPASSPPIVVSGAYVRAQAPPTDAVAAYFTVENNTGTADRLESVTSDAGATTVLHTAGMTADTHGAVIPAHGRLVLSTGHGHVMIEKLFARVRAGQTVHLHLRFTHAGVVLITAKVLALGVTPTPMASMSMPMGGASMSMGPMP